MLPSRAVTKGLTSQIDKPNMAINIAKKKYLECSFKFMDSGIKSN